MSAAQQGAQVHTLAEAQQGVRDDAAPVELTAEQIEALSSDSEGGPAKRKAATRPSLRPGNRLVRRWRGRTYVVDVRKDCLVYEGERFTSLSVIAGKITGTRWSGPKFFGLVS